MHQAAGAFDLAADQHHVGAVGQHHHVVIFQHHVVELAVGVDGDVARGLDGLRLGDELADQGRLGSGQLGGGVGRGRGRQHLLLQPLELVGERLLLLGCDGTALQVDPAGLDHRPFERHLGQEGAELASAGHDIDAGPVDLALDGHGDGLQDAAAGEGDVVALAQHHARELFQGEEGLPRSAVAIAADGDAGHVRLRPRKADQVGAGHRLVRRGLEDEGTRQGALCADQGAAGAHEDGVAFLEPERRGVALEKEVIEVVGGHHLAAPPNGDRPVGAGGRDAAGGVQIEQDVVARAADVAAGPRDVAADEHADGAGVADGGVDPDRAGEDPGDRGGHGGLQSRGRDAADVDRADADDEDVAGGIDDLQAAGVHRAEQIDHHLIARLDRVVGPVRRAGARERSGEQLGAEQRHLIAVGKGDIDQRRRELRLGDRASDRSRARRGARQGVGVGCGG